MIHIGNKDHGQKIMTAASGAVFTPENMQVISRSLNGEFKGGVVYENWTGEGGSITIHIGSVDSRWINRDLLWMMFDYPFNQMKVTRAFAQISSANEDCLKFSKSVGWTILHRIEGVFPDGDMILMRLLREECRFLGLKPKNIRSNKG